MNIYFRFLVMFFTLYGVIVSRSHAQTLFLQKAGPHLVCETKNILFFYQPGGLLFPQHLSCKNQGEAPLLIENLSFANPQDPFFSVQPLAQKKIAPGQEFLIQVSFKPASLSAQVDYQNELIFTSNDSKHLSLRFSVKGQKYDAPFVLLHKNKDDMVEIASSIKFLPIRMIDTATETLFLRKVGNFSSSKYSISIEGRNANVFGVADSSVPGRRSQIVGEPIYLSFQPAKDIESWELALYQPGKEWNASLQLHYQVEQSGKLKTGELLIHSIQGSTKMDQPKEEKTTEIAPSSLPKARYALGVELGPGFSQFPKEIVMDPIEKFKWNDGQIPLVLTRIKPAFIFLPSRGIKDSIGIEFALEPYFEVGSLAKPGDVILGAGSDLKLSGYVDKSNLVSFSALFGIGYRHLSWSPSSVLSQQQEQQKPSLKNEFTNKNHFFLYTAGVGISLGLDRWTKVKGFDLYANALFTMMISYPHDSLGAYFPIGVRYNFSY